MKAFRDCYAGHHNCIGEDEQVTLPTKSQVEASASLTAQNTILQGLSIELGVNQ